MAEFVDNPQETPGRARFTRGQIAGGAALGLTIATAFTAGAYLLASTEGQPILNDSTEPARWCIEGDVPEDEGWITGVSRADADHRAGLTAEQITQIGDYLRRLYAPQKPEPNEVLSIALDAAGEPVDAKRGDCASSFAGIDLLPPPGVERSFARE